MFAESSLNSHLTNFDLLLFKKVLRNVLATIFFRDELEKEAWEWLGKGKGKGGTMMM